MHIRCAWTTPSLDLDFDFNLILFQASARRARARARRVFAIRRRSVPRRP